MINSLLFNKINVYTPKKQSMPIKEQSYDVVNIPSLAFPKAETLKAYHIGKDKMAFGANEEDLGKVIDNFGNNEKARWWLLNGAERDQEALILPGADLSNALLFKANLKGANLSGANLSEIRLGEANLSGANLKGANLEKSYLNEAKLERANLEGANLKGADLERTNLKRATLEKADLSEAKLDGAILKEANLKGANLKNANLDKAVLTGADLTGANLSGAKIYYSSTRNYPKYSTNLEGAKYNDKTILPEDYIRYVGTTRKRGLFSPKRFGMVRVIS